MSRITSPKKDIPTVRVVPSLRIGKMYQPSEETRVTTVRVDDCDIELTENLWKDTEDQFDTKYKWSITTLLKVSGQNLADCATIEEMFASALNNVRVLKALALLDYEVRSVDTDGAVTWERPAPDR